MTKEKLYHQEGDSIREYTEAEYAQAKIDLELWEASVVIKAQQEKDAIAAKKAAEEKLAVLGLTADDLKALGL